MEFWASDESSSLGAHFKRRLSKQLQFTTIKYVYKFDANSRAKIRTAASNQLKHQN